jgi:LysM repeat protein
MLSQAPAIHTAVLTSTTTTEVSSHPHEHIYTIMKGDTLSKIAHKFKTTPAAITAENNIVDPARLTIGKKLRIPSRESRSASITSPVASPVEPSEVKTETPEPVETIRPTPPVEQSNQNSQPAGDLATFTP